MVVPFDSIKFTIIEMNTKIKKRTFVSTIICFIHVLARYSGWRNKIYCYLFVHLWIRFIRWSVACDNVCGLVVVFRLRFTRKVITFYYLYINMFQVSTLQHLTMISVIFTNFYPQIMWSTIECIMYFLQL